MAEFAGPFVGQQNLPGAWQKIGRGLAADGIISGGATFLLTGRTMRMGDVFANVAGFIYKKEENSDFTSPVNTAPAFRIDRLVLELDIRNDTQVGGQTLVPKIITGIPGSGGGAPLVQNLGGVWQLPIASWSVATGDSGGIFNLVDERVYSRQSGIVGVRTWTRKHWLVGPGVYGLDIWAPSLPDSQIPTVGFEGPAPARPTPWDQNGLQVYEYGVYQIVFSAYSFQEDDRVAWRKSTCRFILPFENPENAFGDGFCEVVRVAYLPKDYNVTFSFVNQFDNPLYIDWTITMARLS
jgi:hypothetical protein